MSQHDFDIANQAGAAFRVDLNNALQALVTQNSGPNPPPTPYARMLWPDTTTNTLKRRNAANSDWLLTGTLDESIVISRSSNTMLDVSDTHKVLIATGSYTQTLDAAATLGDGWHIDLIVEPGVTLTLDPDGAQTIDGAATRVIVGPAQGRVVCNGTFFKCLGLTTALLDTDRVDVASAQTINLQTDAPATRHINITGSTAITGFTVAEGLCYFVRFAGALTLTNSASLVTQTGSNITTRTGDSCILRATAPNVVEVLCYTTDPLAAGSPLLAESRRCPQNAQNGNYTLALSDAGGHLYSKNVAAQTITLPLNSAAAIPLGSLITIVNNGTSGITLNDGGAVLKLAGSASTGNRTLATAGVATLIKVEADLWFVSGSGLS